RRQGLCPHRGRPGAVPLLDRPSATVPARDQPPLRVRRRARAEGSVNRRPMFQPNQRVTVDLSGLVIQGVSFSQNVQKALGTILQQVSPDPPVYKVELPFSFKGVKRVDVPEERIQRT